MSRIKRNTTYLMLFVFGMLFFRNLLPIGDESNYSNCAEVAHIHFYKYTPISKVDSFSNLSPSESSDSDEDCHEGKIFSGFLVFPSPTAIEVPRFNAVFDIVFDVQNNFPNPYLEPKRKPPRAS